jgi:hypothetical protein
MPHLDLSDEEAAALIKEHRNTGIRRLRGILAKLRPKPASEPVSPRNVYAPPGGTAATKRRGGR